jgi:hypothetical protein
MLAIAVDDGSDAGWNRSVIAKVNGLTNIGPVDDILCNAPNVGLRYAGARSRRLSAPAPGSGKSTLFHVPGGSTLAAAETERIQLMLSDCITVSARLIFVEVRSAAHPVRGRTLHCTSGWHKEYRVRPAISEALRQPGHRSQDEAQASCARPEANSSGVPLLGYREFSTIPTQQFYQRLVRMRDGCIV